MQCLSPAKKSPEFEGLFLFDEDVCSASPAAKESSRHGTDSFHDGSEFIEDSLVSIGGYDDHRLSTWCHSDPIDIPRKSCWVSSRADDSCSPSYV
eukprot:CAMPEP_0196658680 /NCGR_PEP_ID=MMETSP1086-20130531/30919_1 /TAXON_ID=77921 /ORGANISM="Cyanoptyche  gloeocystis , Strain SAG4.97" /LENGTH=94 /DNA_ID=CAMNT_0041992345 /DNA_START=191 /DNA_END=475 /DNA_ORIENTATION=-